MDPSYLLAPAVHPSPPPPPPSAEVLPECDDDRAIPGTWSIHVWPVASQWIMKFASGNHERCFDSLSFSLLSEEREACRSPIDAISPARFPSIDACARRAGKFMFQPRPGARDRTFAPVFGAASQRLFIPSAARF